MPRIRDQRPMNVDYYRRNRDRELFRVRVRQAGQLELLRDLRRVPCMDCGGNFEPHQMDFDHRDPSTKSFGLTKGRVLLMATAKVLAEVAKCDIVCANCHAVRTQKNWRQRRPIGTSSETLRKRPYWRAHSAALLELRKAPCKDCQRSYSPYSMEFDHRDPSRKVQGVTRMVGRASLRRIMDEAAKCDVVCANCHRMRTFRRRRSEPLLERE